MNVAQEQRRVLLYAESINPKACYEKLPAAWKRIQRTPPKPKSSEPKLSTDEQIQAVFDRVLNRNSA